MKRIIKVLLMMVICVGLIGCSGKGDDKKDIKAILKKEGFAFEFVENTETIAHITLNNDNVSFRIILPINYPSIYFTEYKDVLGLEGNRDKEIKYYGTIYNTDKTFEPEENDNLARKRADKFMENMNISYEQLLDFIISYCKENSKVKDEYFEIIN